MKRAIRILFVVLAIAISMTVLASAERYVTVILDGLEVEFDVRAEIINGRTMVPLRKIFEAMGAEVSWDDVTRTAIAERGTRTVKAQIGNEVMTINSVQKTLDTPPMLKGGRTLVPVRFVAEAFGVLVEWEDSTSTVTLTSPDKRPLSSVWEAPYQYDLTEYLTISEEDYTGLPYTAREVNITEADVIEQLSLLVREKAEYAASAEASASGDSVNIDFKGRVGTKYFAGGSAEKVDLVLGQGQFIPGFEDGIIGHKAGESFEIEVTFPEDYGVDELNGVKAIFEIKLNSVMKPVYPQIDDAFIAANTEYSTLVDYVSGVKAELEASTSLANIVEQKNELFTALMSKIEITAFPQDEYTAYYNMYYEQNKEIAESYGMTLESLLQLSQITPEQFEELAVEYASSTVGMELIFYSIANAEKIIDSLSVADYITYLDTLSAQYGVDFETFENTYGKDSVNNSLVYEKVMELVYSKGIATIVVENN